MRTKEEILGFLSAHKQQFAEQFTVRRIGLFGSYSQGVAVEASDVDILVDLVRPTFDNYMDLKFYLEDYFETSVDLVLIDTLKPRIKPAITREVAYA